MGLQVRIVGIVLLALAVLAASLAVLVSSPPVVLAADDDPAGICVHVRALDPDNEYCLWLTRIA